MLLSLNNISVYKNKRCLLEDVSYKISSGSITTILGPNGGGKSTLLKVCLGFIKPNSGVIKKKPTLRMGYVPQKVTFSDTMPMNVDYFLSLGTDPKKKMDLIDLFDIQSFLKHSIHVLSGGELQKILIARALIKEPDLVILDEPMRGVDIASQNKIYEYLLEMKKILNYSIVMVTHDLNVILSKSDTLMCLNKHICCVGHPSDIQKSDFYRNLGFYDHKHDHLH